MLSRREHSLQLSVCPLPLGVVLEENPFAGCNLLMSPIGENRSLLTQL